jgi:uncharacterized protein YcbK (DUF882 family)
MKRVVKYFLLLLLTGIGVFFLYFNNTRLVSGKTAAFYTQLKDSLRQRNLSPRLLVISTRRFRWHNNIQVKFSGAAARSRHLAGDAIDFLVFDVNADGRSDQKDVDLVYAILDKDIINNKGGIGTYKNERSFINRQMIHVDGRGSRARWHR